MHMMKTLGAAGAVILIGFSGCDLIGSIGSANVVEIASFVDDYSAIKLVEGANVDQDKALLDDEDRAETSMFVAHSEIDSVTRVFDDGGTPGDPIDDTITITRVGTAWNGLLHREVLVRPIRPLATAAWDAVWDAEMRYTQEGSFEHYVENFTTPHRIGTVTATWKKTQTEVILLELTKRLERLDGDGDVVTAIVDDRSCYRPLDEERDALPRCRRRACRNLSGGPQRVDRPRRWVAPRSCGER